MNQLRQGKPIWVVLVTVLILASFIGILFHYHEDGKTDHDCAICRFVRLFALAATSIVLALLANPASRRFVSSEVAFQTALLVSPLKARAPPIS